MDLQRLAPSALPHLVAPAFTLAALRAIAPAPAFRFRPAFIARTGARTIPIALTGARDIAITRARARLVPIARAFAAAFTIAGTFARALSIARAFRFPRLACFTPGWFRIAELAAEAAFRRAVFSRFLLRARGAKGQTREQAEHASGTNLEDGG